MAEIRVYANRDHLTRERGPYLNEICQAVWAQETGEQQRSKYGSLASHFTAVDAPHDADLYLLPLKWNYYLEHDVLPLAWQESQRAGEAGRRLVVFSDGDFSAHLPFDRAILFERCAYASRRGRNGGQVFALPPYIANYLDLYCSGQIRLRSWQPVPVVGFCGQADGSWLDFIRRELVIQYRKATHSLHLRKWEPAPFEATRFRKKILASIASSPGVKNNFVLRRRYRAGYLPKVKDPFHPTRVEFIQNILGSDYTVCMRGGGNFSVRFYETLALGRIPVFVNTDCVLPYDHIIDYRQYCVWVEQTEIPWIGEKILDFHHSHSGRLFVELQEACHALWRERLSKEGFFSHFKDHFLPESVPAERAQAV